MKAAIFFVTAVLLLISHAESEIIMQQPIGGYPKATKEVGSPCQFSSECLSRCCVSDGRRFSCSERGSIGDKCSGFQIKGGLFPYACPCSSGLWITTWTQLEQPTVNYKHQILAIFDVQDVSKADTSYIAWSTFPQFNLIHQEKLRIPLVKSREEDANRDGKNDVLYLDLEVPIKDNEDVHGLNVIIFFTVQLQRLARMTLEGMAVINTQNYLAGAGYNTIGDLKLKQKVPIVHKGVDTTWNSAVVKVGSLIPADYDLLTLYKEYSARNVSTYYNADYPVWTAGRPADGVFKLHAEISYPELNILYHVGFWQMFKYALVQYIAILLIFAFLCERFKFFVFSHQLINTVAIKPYKNS